MPEISLNIKPHFLEMLQGLSEEIASYLFDELAIPTTFPDDDPDMAFIWRETLLEHLSVDCQELIDFLREEQLTGESFHLEKSRVESIIRACSAIRQKIRSLCFNEFEESFLESYEQEPDSLPEEFQKIYACYTLLAVIQETLVCAIDPLI